jgi:hypothetical protein
VVRLVGGCGDAVAVVLRLLDADGDVARIFGAGWVVDLQREAALLISAHHDGEGPGRNIGVPRERLGGKERGQGDGGSLKPTGRVRHVAVHAEFAIVAVVDGCGDVKRVATWLPGVVDAGGSCLLGVGRQHQECWEHNGEHIKELVDSLLDALKKACTPLS